MFNLDKTNKDEQCTIINIIIDITTEALKNTFWALTTNMGLVERAKPLINMKQESKRLNYTAMYNAKLLELLGSKGISSEDLYKKYIRENVQRLSKAYFRRKI